MKKCFLVLFLLGGCATMHKPEVWDHPDKTYTLRLFTGTMGECLYEKNFELKAKEVCPSGYTIIEKTFKPTTLHKNNYDNAYYNWIIKCK